jgi:hypothetical protein
MYIDDVKNKLTVPKINFIAQQVEKIVPSAVTYMDDYIPSIYAKYTVQIINETKLKILNLKKDFILITTKLKFITLEEKEHIGEVYYLDSTSTYLIVEDSSKIENEIFVFGHLVNDCRTLNKDALFTLCIGAVQEIHERTSEKILMLENKIQKLEEIITKFLN